MPQETPQKASDETTWIAGAKPAFQTLRLNVNEDGRIFVGAQGWCKKMMGNQWVNLELTAAGLHQLNKASQKALDQIQKM